MEKSLKECLNDAANLIETSGWCRGTYSRWGANNKMHFCFVGAINHVCPETGYKLRASVDLSQKMGFDNLSLIFGFNDRAKKKSTVIKKMREIAARLPDEDTAPVNCA